MVLTRKPEHGAPSKATPGHASTDGNLPVFNLMLSQKQEDQEQNIFFLQKVHYVLCHKSNLFLLYWNRETQQQSWTYFMSICVYL